MHQHSDKIDPKKAMITAILFVLFLVFGWCVSKAKENSQKVEDKTVSGQAYTAELKQ